MTTPKHTLLMLALAGFVTLPALAVEKAEDKHAGHPLSQAQASAPAQTQSAAPSAQERRQTMRQRMQEIRATQDPDRRRQLIEAQMQDMEAMLDEGACPLAGGGMTTGQGRQGMMGGMMGRGMQYPGMGGGCMQHGSMGGQAMQHSGMACGMGGRGMQCGMAGQGRSGADDAITRRLEALEKRVDLLQMLLQTQER